MKKIILALFALALLSPYASKAQGCMDEGSDDGVKIIGYIQPMYEYQFLEAGADPIHGLRSPSSFFFERARIGIMGSIPYDFSYYVMTEFSPTKGGPYLLDAFITYKRLAPWLNASLGQFKGIFGLELGQGCHKLNTIYRSRVVNELASPFRNLGLMVYGGNPEGFWGLKRENMVQWKFSLTNGTGENITDNNREKTYTARVLVNPWKFVKVGFSYSYGRHRAQDPTQPEDRKTRMGADISLEKWNWKLQAEFIDGYDQGGSWIGGGCGATPVYATGNFWKQGYFAQLMYRTPWNLEPVVKYATYDADIKVDDNIISDYTFGFNYYFNETVRLQLNYVVTQEEVNEKQNNFIVTQMQVRF